MGRRTTSSRYDRADQRRQLGSGRRRNPSRRSLRRNSTQGGAGRLTGRRAASAHGIALIGTLGVVLRAKQRGLISELRPLVYQLRAMGLYANEPLIQQVLAAAGE